MEKKNDNEALLQIKEDIKQNTLQNVYLLYGTEQQVVKMYRNMLLKALLGSDSLETLKEDMNFSLFAGAPLDTDAFISIASSYPFLAEKRVILVENSTAFLSDNPSLAECIKNLPETTYVIFSEIAIHGKRRGGKKKEEDADSENDIQNENDVSEDVSTESIAESGSGNKKRFLEAVKKVGRVAEINEQPQAAIERWIIGYFSNAGKRISRAALDTLLMRAGLDMMRLNNEMDKIIAYKGEEQDVKTEDVIAVVSADATEQVFKMIEAMSDRNPDLAMKYYLDMLEVRTPPQKIMSLIERQMRILYQVKDMRDKGFDDRAIVERVKEVKQFFVRKIIGQARKFTMQEISDCMNDCIDYTLQTRKGAISDRMAVEMIIVKYSQPK